MTFEESPFQYRLFVKYQLTVFLLRFENKIVKNINQIHFCRTNKFGVTILQGKNKASSDLPLSD